MKKVKNYQNRNFNELYFKFHKDTKPINFVYKNKILLQGFFFSHSDIKI